MTAVVAPTRDEPLRFGILSQWYDPEPGSAAVPAVLARGLLERGHQVQVVTGFPNYPTGVLAEGYKLQPRLDEQLDGVDVRRVALFPSHDRSAAKRVTNYASFALSASLLGAPALKMVDAVWVYNSPATVGLPSWLTSRRAGPPHLMHVVDLWPDSIAFSGIANSSLYKRIDGPLQVWCNWTYQQAAAIAGISHGICETLVERGVPSAKVHHIPVWTDEDRFVPGARDEELASELGVSHKFVVLYAGNIGETQGLDLLLEVCAKMTDLPRFHVLVAGSGTAEGRLHSRATQLGLRNLSFLGRWPADDMDRLMTVGDLHLVSLNDHPLARITLPSKVPAILCAGRPIVAVAQGEVARIVEESRAGWSVRPGDLEGLEKALREACSMEPTALRSLGRRARRYYERNLSRDQGISAVEELLVSIMRRRRT